MENSPFVFEVNAENFTEIVIHGSNKQPILVDFWADWCQPCQMLMPVLSKLADDYAGQFILAKVNSDENQTLATEHGIRSLPTVKLFKDGVAVDEFMGALPEGQIREFLSQYIETESDHIHAQALDILEKGNHDEALTLLRKAHTQEPQKASIAIDLAKALISINPENTKEAESILLSLPADERDKPETTALLARLEFSEQTQGLPDLATLQSQADNGDLKATHQLALQQINQGDYQPAMENLLLIMKKDRQFEDDIGRRTLLKVFDMLGSDPLVETFRRKMFSFLY